MSDRISGFSVVSEAGVTRRLQAIMQRLTVLHRLADQADQTLAVEVDIGQGREDRLAGKEVDLAIDDTVLAGGMGIKAQPLDCVDEQVLKVGNLRGLAADSDGGTGDSFGGLFTLITKHVCLL